MLRGEFAPDEATNVKTERTNEKLDPRIVPAETVALRERDQRARPSDVLNSNAPAVSKGGCLARAIFVARNENEREDTARDSDGNADGEDEAPIVEIVDDPAADHRTERGREHHA